MLPPLSVYLLGSDQPAQRTWAKSNTDTQAHRAALTQWKYRGIYRVSDAHVGVSS